MIGLMLWMREVKNAGRTGGRNSVAPKAAAPARVYRVVDRTDGETVWANMTRAEAERFVEAVESDGNYYVMAM